MEVIRFDTEQTENEPNHVTPSAEPIKRRRGRPPKSVTDAAIKTGETTETKPTRTRRASKLSGSDVEKIVVQASDLYVMFTRRKYWHVDPSEVAPWSNQAADILNAIPSKYVKMFFDSSGYFAVGFGLYNIAKPRIEMDAIVNAQIRQGKRPAPTQPQPTSARDDEPERTNDDLPPVSEPSGFTDQLLDEVA